MKNKQQVEDVFVGPFMTSHSALQAALSDLSKLTNSPLPRPYVFQVQLFIWSYLIFLPYQLYPKFGYLTIPAVAVAAIAFLGFLELACQLERPFEYDNLCSLPLAKYTAQTARHLAQITAVRQVRVSRGELEVTLVAPLDYPFQGDCPLAAELPTLATFRHPGHQDSGDAGCRHLAY
jgi:predicted membrane chloride channel (bestrophin family)